MSVWKVTPNTKKSIIERTFWKKDDNIMVEETGWRWGEFLITTDDDEPPVLEPGVDLYCCDYECELVETSDGCWCDRDMSDCDDETKEWLENFLEENSIYDLEEHGWYQTDTEMIMDCEMTIELVEE